MRLVFGVRWRCEMLEILYWVLVGLLTAGVAFLVYGTLVDFFP